MTTDWIQHTITPAHRETPERLAAERLAPVLNAAQDSGALDGWWYMRKEGLRLRYRAAAPEPAVTALLDTLVEGGLVEGWATVIYEPETEAFGGPEAMEVAHRLFHADSRHLLARAAEPGPPALGRAETVAVLVSAMLRAAGLDWYEQGDVWAKFAMLRDAPAPVPPERAATLTAAMQHLMHLDTWALTRDTTPLAHHGGWVHAFQQAGQDLARLARDGVLTRGLRSVLAHHLLFHANRSGLPVDHQAAMAARALDAVFHSDEGPAPSASTIHATTKVAHMTTLGNETDSATPAAEQLRAALTDRLLDQGAIRTATVEAAFRAVPREPFLPGFPLEVAYADNPIYTKTDGSGAQISAASQPAIVAMMLGQLGAQPGEKIFEAGAGTGVNAAYMATIVGPSGHVVAVDVDEDLVDGARKHLSDSGITNVDVVLGDGALGYPDGAPYDRVIATVSTSEMPTAWLQQVKPTGRIVLPLRLRGTASRVIAFERHGDSWASVNDRLAVFMPLRGSMDDARRTVTLTGEGDVTLQVHKDQDEAVNAELLAGVLDGERYDAWSGVTIPAGTTYEYQDLWLALRLPTSLMRMSVTGNARDRGVHPMFGWGAMATIHADSLAYLTLRPGEPDADGRKTYETGAIGHGPAGELLADLVAEEIRTWNAGFRGRTLRFELPDNPATADPGAGRFVLDRPNHPITVIWE
ncbi:protein-L-isoaspartate(D-aspartate) O-methyltransferase [Kitasatospora sp. MAA19]|uniref:methyltransferase, FxLD system n=1 Tax=unclassified Kitasatospora TaxID=2633591 RepID=UPI00247375BC|nr:methyltransferase, FxLD system [Kitasatospora sp. MAA19]MDH6709207.1 protein-L-isoaspartate(D-aspartate) O-methyltransferase [Kitasatospora sp. MAA19]